MIAHNGKWAAPWLEIDSQLTKSTDENRWDEKAGCHHSHKTESPVSEEKVYTFVLDQIETVPHLEALLLLWNSRPQPWTVENLSKRLYVSKEIVDVLLDDLVRRGLIVCVQGAPDGYRYESSSIAQDQLLSTLDLTYRRETVRISTMIHSKPSASVREFARAFRFKKERE